MAQLGNRILFYEIAGEEVSEDELIEFAKKYEASDAIDECRRVINGFVERHFENCGINSVDPDGIPFPDDLVRELVRYAQLIANGRVEVFNENGFEAGLPEGPHRVILLLQMLARGLALVEGHSEVSPADMAVIRHVAFSSIPCHRRNILRAVLDAGGVCGTLLKSVESC